jgi:hypothetical protein
MTSLDDAIAAPRARRERAAAAADEFAADLDCVDGTAIVRRRLERVVALVDAPAEMIGRQSSGGL